MLGSFPLYVVTHKISPSTKSNHLLERIDKTLPNAFCNVTGMMKLLIHLKSIILNTLYVLTGDCGECSTTMDEVGVIESHNFPNEYGANLNCLFTLKAPTGKKIRLTFTEFHVKKCCDFITVRYFLLQLKIMSLQCSIAGLWRISQSTSSWIERLRNSR